MCGQVDPDDASLGIEALKAQLTEAGMDEIIAEVQEENAGGEAAPEAFMNKIYK